MKFKKDGFLFRAICLGSEYLPADKKCTIIIIKNITMTNNVLITGPVSHQVIEEFADKMNIKVWRDDKKFLMPADIFYAEIADYEAVINFSDIVVTEKFVNAAKKLKIIVNATIGYDNLDLPLLTEHNIWAANAPGYFNYPVAEYTLGCLLSLLRKIGEADSFVRNNCWRSFEPGRWDGVSLREKTLGIVGLGAIGYHIREMAQALGTQVIYHDPIVNTHAGWVTFEKLITSSDIISINVPLTDKTGKLFNRKAFDMMKDGAIIVNTARGAVVEQEALVEALVSGKLSGAVLDVFDNEPNVPDILKAMSHVILTPHIAGGTKQARENCFRLSLQSVLEVFHGNPPLHPLNHIA